MTGRLRPWSAIDDFAPALRRLNASKPVEVARMEAHAAFDPLWRSGAMSRTAAYKWLAYAMGLPPSKTHMEQFDVEQCLKVIRLVQEFNK